MYSCWELIMRRKIVRMSTSTVGKYASTKLSRNIWNNATYKALYETHKSHMVLKSNYFPTSSFRGNKFADNKDTFTSSLLFKQDTSVVVRGMHKKEMDSKINQELYALVGSRPLRAYNEDGTIDVQKTSEWIEEHRRGEGGTRGISTSESLMVGIQYSGYYFPESQVMMLIDTENIPSGEKFNPTRSSSLEDTPKHEPIMAMNTDPEQSVGGTAGERELTISSVHTSAIIAGVSRDGWNFNFDYNPLYVDQNLLSENLKHEYLLLMKEFYRIVPLARDNLDDPQIQKLTEELMEKLREFYKKYGQEAGLSATHIKAQEAALSGSPVKTIKNATKTIEENVNEGKSKEKRTIKSLRDEGTLEIDKDSSESNKFKG